MQAAAPAAALLPSFEPGQLESLAAWLQTSVMTQPLSSSATNAPLPPASTHAPAFQSAQSKQRCAAKDSSRTIPGSSDSSWLPADTQQQPQQHVRSTVLPHALPSSRALPQHSNDLKGMHGLQMWQSGASPTEAELDKDVEMESETEQGRDPADPKPAASQSASWPGLSEDRPSLPSAGNSHLQQPHQQKAALPSSDSASVVHNMTQAQLGHSMTSKPMQTHAPPAAHPTPHTALPPRPPPQRDTPPHQSQQAVGLGSGPGSTQTPGHQSAQHQQSQVTSVAAATSAAHASQSTAMQTQPHHGAAPVAAAPLPHVLSHQLPSWQGLPPSHGPAASHRPHHAGPHAAGHWNHAAALHVPPAAPHPSWGQQWHHPPCFHSTPGRASKFLAAPRICRPADGASSYGAAA